VVRVDCTDGQPGFGSGVEESWVHVGQEGDVEMAGGEGRWGEGGGKVGAEEGGLKRFEGEFTGVRWQRGKGSGEDILPELKRIPTSWSSATAYRTDVRVI